LPGTVGGNLTAVTSFKTEHHHTKYQQKSQGKMPRLFCFMLFILPGQVLSVTESLLYQFRQPLCRWLGKNEGSWPRSRSRNMKKRSV